MDINVELFYFINNTLQNHVFDLIMPYLTHVGGFCVLSVLLIIIILYSWFKKYQTLKRIAILALIAFLFSDIIVFLLKNIFQEPRPFVSLNHVHLLISESDPNSFPSGHTTSTLSVVTIFILKMKKLSKNHYKLLNLALIIFALLIPFSRIYVGVHYPFDVLAGAVIGICGSLIIYKLNEVLSIIKF